MNKFKPWLLMALVAALLVGCSQPAATEDTQPSTEEVVIDSDFEVFGKVDSGTAYELSLPKSIKVTKVLVKQGQIVNKGDALFTVDFSDIVTEEAMLKSQIQSIEEQIGLGNPSYSKASLYVEQLQTKLADAQKKLTDNRSLYEAQAISKAELDAAIQAVKVLQNNLQSAKYDVTSSLQADKQTTSAKKLELEQAKLKLDNVKKMLNHPQRSEDQIICDIDKAIVAELTVQNGSYLQAYTRAALLTDQSQTLIVANVAEEQIKNIALGKKVTVKPLMDSELSIEGEITFISAQASYTNGETVIPIEITCSSDEGLAPNLNVDVVIPID